MTKEGSIYRAAVHRGRGFKSSQWASRKHSVIQDISFHQVIVIHCNDCFQEIISDIRKHLLVTRIASYDWDVFLNFLFYCNYALGTVQ